MLPPAESPPLPPPPIDADKIGPDNLKTVDRMLLSPLAGAGLESSSSSSPVDALSLLFPLLPPLLDPDEPPRTPLLNPPLRPANFCDTAEIFGVMMPEMRAWKLGTGFGASMPAALFFSMFVLSNRSMNLVLASMNESIFYENQLLFTNSEFFFLVSNFLCA